VFGLADTAYFNVSADGVEQPLDWIIGILTMVFVDQKMMALFSLLFGVGVVLFAERASAGGRPVAWPSLWRFALLLPIGLAHRAVWDGDVLVLYALCAPVVLALRRLPAWLLAVTGVALSLLGAVTAPVVQADVGPDGAELGDLWLVDAGEMSESVETWFFVAALGRALGLMLLGVALYRWGVVQGDRSDACYRRIAGWGLGLGVAVTAAGVASRVGDGWSADHALVGRIPTDLGTIPMALGYLALIVLWDRSGDEHVERFRNAGRLALTNYLSQTVLGLTTLSWLLGDVDLTRTGLATWVLGVWMLQLWWSTWWLRRFRYGPAEWLWRSATYRSFPPMRRTPT
jgi:uncharacterized protein